MQVWNVLLAARCEYRTQKIAISPHRATLSGHIFATKARIDNWKKTCQTAMPPPHVLIIWWTLAYYRLRSVGEFEAPPQISVGFASWHHLYSAGWPSRWALAHISSIIDDLPSVLWHCWLGVRKSKCQSTGGNVGSRQYFDTYVWSTGRASSL